MLTAGPAEWLIEQFDKTERSALYRKYPPTGVCPLPMFKLKSITDAGQPMRVTETDYRDTQRRFL